MSSVIVIALLIVVVAKLHILGTRIVEKTELKIPEQSRHEHLHLLHRKKK